MVESSIPQIILKEGIVSFYVQIQGPITERIIKMALDTGATFTMIPPEIATDIGYDPVLSKKRIEISTASGSIITPMLNVKSISCLGTKVSNVDVVCHNLPSQSPVEGLLGLNFLVHLPAFVEFLRKIYPPTIS